MTPENDPAASLVGSDSGTSMPSEKNGADWRSSAEAVATLLKHLVPYAIIVFVLLHWGTVDRLLDRLDYVKYGGLEARLDAARQADQIVNNAVAANVSAFQRTERPYFDTALRQYVRIGAAVTGARILWVDPQPQNQRYERHLLSTLGISIDVERDTASALKRVQENQYDLVLSNITTPEANPTLSPQPRPLVRCPAALLAFEGPPQAVSERPGIIRAEILADDEPEWFAGPRPRIIFYSASGGGGSAGVIADKCSRLVTNRADILLEGVVSALADLRSSSLPPITKFDTERQSKDDLHQ